MICDFDHPHPDHPCGRRVVNGLTRCRYCGHLDNSPECHCWRPATDKQMDGWDLQLIDGKESGR